MPPQMNLNDYHGTLPLRIKKIYNQCTDKEKYYLRKILEELALEGQSTTYEKIWLSDYNEIPVDIDTFLEDDLYLGKTTRNGQAIYPFWRKVMREIFNSNDENSEVIFTGATRIGKTSTAITCCAYMLYRMMCLKDPQAYFNKKDVSVFSLIFLNVTIDLARSVAYREFNDTVQGSSWFMNRGHMSRSEQNPYYIPDGGKVEVTYGSSGSSALGKQIFLCCLDEANFSNAGIKDISKAKERMMDTYNTVSTRIRGTFRQEGRVMGKLFAVSSKKADNDFLEEHIEQQRKAGADKHMYICEAPQWEVLPPSNFSKEKFYIAVGNRYQKGYVIPDNDCTPEGLDDIRKQGYTIMTPPVDYKPEFLADFEISLRDIAGISIPGSTGFLTQELLTSCLTHNRRNPFYNDVLSIGTKDTLTIKEFFHSEIIGKDIKSKPIFIHLDLSITTDRTGIGGVYVERRSTKDENGNIVPQLMISHLFSVGVQAPTGDRIPYSKILNFICWLRKQGFNIQGISMDTFQSEYMYQLVEAQGFDVQKLSVDRTPDAYMALRNCMLEHRFELLDVETLSNELIYLERDSFSGKIDHPVGGSKDLSDCIAGSTYNSILHNPTPNVAPKKVAQAIAGVNGSSLGTHRKPTSPLPNVFGPRFEKK